MNDDFTEVVPTPRVASQEWHTPDVQKAAFVLYAGYELLRTDLIAKKHGGMRVMFVMAQNSELPALLDKFAKGELLVEPQALFEAHRSIHDAMYQAKKGTYLD